MSGASREGTARGRRSVLVVTVLALGVRAQCGRREPLPGEDVAVRTGASTYTVEVGTAIDTFAKLPVLRPGDIVYVKPGIYGHLLLRGNNPQNGDNVGTPAAPIKIIGLRKEDGTRPRITGDPNRSDNIKSDGTPYINAVDFEDSQYVIFSGFDVTAGTSR